MNGLLCNPNIIPMPFLVVALIAGFVWSFMPRNLQGSPYPGTIAIALAGLAGGGVGLGVRFILIVIFRPAC